MGIIIGDASVSFASGSGSTKLGDSRDDVHQMTGSFMLQADVSNGYAAIIDNDESSAGHGLKVTSDGNGTGTYLLDVESQSTTVFRVRGDGRVGIGVTSPGSTLSVDDEIAVGEKLIHRGDPDTYLQFPGQNQMILAANDYAFLTYDGDIKINNATRDRDTQILADDGNVVLHVDAGDNRVGIGTTSPDCMLHVNGALKTAGITNYEVQSVDLGSGTSGTITPSSSMVFLDCDSIAASGAGYFSVTVATSGYSNGDTVRLVVTTDVNAPIMFTSGLLHDASKMLGITSSNAKGASFTLTYVSAVSKWAVLSENGLGISFN